MDREAAGAVDRVGVASIDVEIGASRAPASAVVQTEGNPDSRSMHGTSIAICGMLAGWRRS
jgi:hypothetical protein